MKLIRKVKALSLVTLIINWQTRMAIMHKAIFHAIYIKLTKLTLFAVYIKLQSLLSFLIYLKAYKIFPNHSKSLNYSIVSKAY